MRAGVSRPNRTSHRATASLLSPRAKAASRMRIEVDVLPETVKGLQGAR